MFKRARWMGLGYAAGIGTSWYVARAVRSAARRYTPPEMVGRLGDSVGAAGRRVRDAIDDGRAARAARERELRAALGLETPPGLVRSAR